MMAMKNDNNTQHSGQTTANRLMEARSLGLQYASLMLDICIKVIDPFKNKVSSDQYHITILQTQV